MTYPKLAALSAALPDPIGPDCTELHREAVECYRELMKQGEPVAWLYEYPGADQHAISERRWHPAMLNEFGWQETALVKLHASPNERTK